MGWMNARIQTWFSVLHSPVHEWQGVAGPKDGPRGAEVYSRQDNCFAWIEDLQRAQRLFDEQLQVNWAERFAAV